MWGEKMLVFCEILVCGSSLSCHNAHSRFAEEVDVHFCNIAVDDCFIIMLILDGLEDMIEQITGLQLWTVMKHIWIDNLAMMALLQDFPENECHFIFNFAMDISSHHGVVNCVLNTVVALVVVQNMKHICSHVNHLNGISEQRIEGNHEIEMERRIVWIVQLLWLWFFIGRRRERGCVLVGD